MKTIVGGTKAHISWLPAEHTTVDFHAGASHQRNDNGSLIRSDEVEYHAIRDPDDNKEIDAVNLGMKIGHEFDSVVLHSVSTISENKYKYRQNLNYYTPADKWIGLFDIETTLFTQELRLQSKDDDGIKWLGGLFYSHEEEDIIEAGTIMHTTATLGYDKRGTRCLNRIRYHGRIRPGIHFPDKYNKVHGRRKITNISIRSWIPITGLPEPIRALHCHPRLIRLKTTGPHSCPRGTLSWNFLEDAMAYIGVSKGYLPGG